MAKQIRDNDDLPSFENAKDSEEIKYWFPSKTHSIDVDSAIYSELTELIKESGLTIEELLLDLVKRRTEGQARFSERRLRQIDVGGRKNKEVFLKHLDKLETKEQAVQRLEETKKRLQTFEYNFDRTKTDVPKTYIANVRRFEILLNIASCENNKLTEKMNIVKSEFSSSSREDIKRMVHSKMKDYGIFTIFPDLLNETSRKNLLKWEKDFENDLAWLKKEKYIYTKNDELYVYKDEFLKEFRSAREMYEQKKLNTFIHSYNMLAQVYDLHFSDNKSVARWYASEVTNRPFEKVLIKAQEEDKRRRTTREK